MSIKMVSKMSGFYLGKARVGVLSLPIPHPIHNTKTKTQSIHNTTNNPTTTPH